MECLRITGPARLEGRVNTSGSKNAALPIMAASILANGPVWLDGVPRLTDVDTLSLLLGHLGVEVKRQLDGSLRIETVDPLPTTADDALVRRMRASFCILGPTLARRGRVVLPLPGGCRIGARPVNLHLAGLSALGAEIRIERGFVIAAARRLRGAELDLRGPRGPTVTGTANVMSAAVLAHGKTIIRGAAREPEIVDLGHFLGRLGARIAGLGTDVIEIVGVDGLNGGRHAIIPDRVEAGTLLIAVAISGGSATVLGARRDHLVGLLDVLETAGMVLGHEHEGITLRAPARPRPFDICAQPFPGIPTDLQAQLMALAAVADGRSRVSDTVFPERFAHVDELRRLGAQIERVGTRAIVRGVPRLLGATVVASDLRASAALVLAGLAAHGTTTVRATYHLDRGYERLEAKLACLGAQIVRSAGHDVVVDEEMVFEKALLVAPRGDAVG